MLGHKLNYSPLILFQLYSHPRLSASLPNYKDPNTTNNRYWRANPNLLSLRFQSGFESDEKILEGIPSEYVRMKTGPFHSYFFTINRVVAAKIANAVMSSVLKTGKNTTVIEVNPGPGLITQELIKNDLGKLIVLDYLNCPYFLKWSSDYVGKIEVIMNVPTSKGINMLQFSDNVNKGNHCTVILLLPQNRFLRLLSYQIIHYDWDYYKNVEFYLALSSDVYDYYHSEKTSGKKVVDYGLCGVLFDIEILEEFKRSDFLPEGKKQGEKVYFLRLVRKTKSLLKKKDAKLYYYFLLNVLLYKNQLILQSMERWFPGIGPALIASGIKVTDYTKDFSPEELLKIFFLIKELGWNLKSLKI